MAEPDGTDGENQRPDEKNDSIKLVALELAEKSEAITFEDSRADERSETVVRRLAPGIEFARWATASILLNLCTLF